MATRGNSSTAASGPFLAVRDRVGTQCVNGALQGIYVGGPTSINGDTAYGRHLQTGVSKVVSDGNPSAPCLSLDYPGFWRFRWSLSNGTNTISVDAKQNGAQTERPSFTVKANTSVGLVSDVVTFAGTGTGWVTIGPTAVVSSGSGAVWVELHNNCVSTFLSPCYFDHIVVA